jgi:hypothetical protein|tara:strand:+ start:414 stop:620 length:207 start_codon:yes stop_codon:yes gene_type:complete
VENDANWVVSYHKDHVGHWTVVVFDGVEEYTVSHSDESRRWCERWAGNYIALREQCDKLGLERGSDYV